MNVWWDRSLREEYIRPLRVTIWTVIVVAVVVALATGRTLAEAVLVFASLLPGLRVWNDELTSHQRTSERHQTILGHLTKTRDDIRAGRMSAAEARAESRKIQDAIFQQRATAPLGVPSKYWRSREANENAYREEVLRVASELQGTTTSDAPRMLP